MTAALKKKIFAGKRITPAEALSLFSWDLLELGGAADFRRRLVHPQNTVGFILDRIINFTNICEACCSFCAFHSRAALPPYELSVKEILHKTGELAAMGGSQVMLQGGLHPDHGIEHYAGLLKAVKKKYPGIALHSFSPSELVHAAKKSRLPLDEALIRLKAAGLASMPGASDLLVDRIRSKVSPRKITTAQWEEVMRALARHGLPSSATMTYGMGETLRERVKHLEVVRRTQDATGIIRAFIPWSFSPGNTRLPDIVPATGVDYLKIVAVSRIFLDNVRYIQAGWLTEGLKLAQVALAMGANDMGGVLTEERVVKATGSGARACAEEFIDLIKNAGRAPVLRDSAYRVIDRRPWRKK
jgi:cyclic dehypoxanthinyl futalosine synthase